MEFELAAMSTSFLQCKRQVVHLKEMGHKGKHPKRNGTQRETPSRLKRNGTERELNIKVTEHSNLEKKEGLYNEEDNISQSITCQVGVSENPSHVNSSQPTHHR